MRNYHTTSTPPWQHQQGQPGLLPGQAMETAVPARPANVASDVLVPLLQALVTGALVAGAVVLFAGAADLDVKRWPLFGAVTLTCTAVAWLLLLGQHRKLLWAIERIVGQDLDDDAHVGEPQERVVIVNGRDHGARPRAEQLTGIMGFVARIPAKGTAMGTWEKELGRDTYVSYRDALITAGWADWKSYAADGTVNETQGWALTADVAEILENIVA